jgi:2-dehydropantoate 2-reductase
MSVLIVGIGALGCLFAARLAASGCPVTMLGSWPDGLAALRKHGVRLLEMDGSSHNYPVELMVGSESQVKFIHALVLVKAWQTERAAKQLEHCLSEAGLALTLQNGLGNYEILSDRLTPGRVALGVTTVGARMLEPGYVQYTGKGRVSIGASPNIDKLAGLLTEAGFEVEITPDPTSLLWGKLVINAAINPLTAVLRVANGELLDRPGAHALLAEAAREAALVAMEEGVVLPYPDPIAAVEQVARNTASNYSSMLQDVQRGAITEIEAINGAIIRVGERSGIPTPVNKMLYQLVSSLDHH